MNKPVYSGLSIFEICKIVLYEFLCGYVKPKYGEKVKLCYMDTDSFMVYIQIEEEYIYSDIVKMLKLDLVLQIMNQIDHCLKLGGKIIK